MTFIESIKYIRESKRREAELSARLEESEKRIDERRRARWEELGIVYSKDKR